MWYVAKSATVTKGSTVVTVNTGDDISNVQERSGLVFEDSSPVEIVKAYLDGSAKKIIQLARPWPYATKTNKPLVIYPTDADFAAATAELRRVIGTLQVASTVEAQAGTDDERIMTPLKVKQAFTARTGTSASRDVGTSAGNVMEVGAFGLGSGEGAVVVSDFDTILSTSEGATIFIRSSFKPDNSPTIGYNYFAGVFRSIYTGYYVYEVRAAAPKDNSFTWRRYYSSGTWGDWVREYGSENIVGTVTQSGGVPTGAIIESGSNSNGRYWKSAGGQLICDNNNKAITTNPATFVGSITSIDGNKLRIGKWF